MNGPEMNAPDTFKHGSTWVRADFHLHTRRDGEFKYSGEENRFISDYIQALSAAGIRVGVISNHNKFDPDEFKALRKRAKKGSIFLLPGVELSVNDGANGIHTLVVFSEEWIEGGKDHINPFLSSTFSGKSPGEYEHENGRSSDSLLETVKKLESYQRDFFLVFAHVEDKSGLWHELEGGRIRELGENEYFGRRGLAFQKVRTHDAPDRKCRQKVTDWLGEHYPAEVEGSDCKTLDQIGKGRACYLKIGDFTFEAVKYALLDFRNRIRVEPERHERSYISSATFEGGVLDGKTLHFSPELNTLIGIRGSGKSSILEALRYALDTPFGEKAMDREYKQRLVEHTLGSGGKVTVQAVDRRGQPYEICRILNEQPDVYVEGILQPGISIRETILHKPIYFGQKDLSSTGEGFEKDLVEKLVGEKLTGIRSRIDMKRQEVAETIEHLRKDFESKKQDAEFRLKFYRQHGVEEKLQKQVDFDVDSRKCAQVLSFVKSYLAELEEFISRYEDDIKNQRIYKSGRNGFFFEEFFTTYDKILTSFKHIKDSLTSGKEILEDLKTKGASFERLKEGLKEEFAEIERKLAEELKGVGAKAILADEFRRLRKTVDQAKQMLEALEKEEAQRTTLHRELLKQLVGLNDLWHEEYRSIQAELDKVNKSHSSLEIKAEYKGDKEAFVEYMKDIFRGSRIRETTFKSLAGVFSDFGAMYRDFGKAKAIVGGVFPTFVE